MNFRRKFENFEKKARSFDCVDLDKLRFLSVEEM